MRVLIPLKELLKSQKEEQILSFLQKFTCKNNAELQDFIHKKALEFEKSERARSFLFIRDKKLEAFFTLALNIFDTKNLSNNAKKRLSPKNCKDDFIPCFIIGQLGKDDKSSLKGQKILEAAMGGGGIYLARIECLGVNLCLWIR